MAAKKDDVVVENGAVYLLRAGTPVYVKTADICAMTGKSNQWVGQLVSQGTLSKRNTPYGTMFDVTAAIHSYCSMLEERTEKPENPADKEKQNAEVSIKKAKAIISVLEAKELQGKMHRSEDVANMTEDLIYAIRGMLVALPGRLAVNVSEISTPAEAAEVVRKEVYAIMKELANYKYDPKKYEERVRERRDWDTVNGHNDDDE